jgi:hypothetical protein
MNINIAILIRRQTKDEICILSIFKNEAALDMNAYRDPQAGNPLRKFIEDNFLNILSFPRQIIREIFNSVSPYKKPADIIATLLFNLQ